MSILVLYEDNHLVAVYKPHRLLVQADSTGDPCLLEHVREYIKTTYEKPGNVFVGLLHRLDRPAAGIVLFAKTSKGASRLSDQIRSRQVQKHYLAWVEGRLHEGQDVEGSMRDGKYARLSFEALETDGKNTLISINLITGRKHQIRSQLASLGHPLLGDKKYGATQPYQSGSIALVATQLRFKKATTDEIVTIQLPDELVTV